MFVRVRGAAKATVTGREKEQQQEGGTLLTDRIARQRTQCYWHYCNDCQRWATGAGRAMNDKNSWWEMTWAKCLHGCVRNRSRAHKDDTDADNVDFVCDGCQPRTRGRDDQRSRIEEVNEVVEEKLRS